MLDDRSAEIMTWIKYLSCMMFFKKCIIIIIIIINSIIQY